MTASPLGRAGTDSDDDLGPFAGVREWIFDLDNTLYPRHSLLWEQIDARMSAFIGRELKLGLPEAARLQHELYDRYGATLRGLMVEHGVSPDAFLAYVHDIDHSVVEPDPVLASAISRLPGRRFILTNGSRRHAERVAERLGISDHFEDIFDIVWARHLPKPGVGTYERLVAATGLDPGRTAIFEDLARNLVVPQRQGMVTVLVLPPGTRNLFRGEWDLDRGPDREADFLTENLGGFLAAVVRAIGAD